MDRNGITLPEIISGPLTSWLDSGRATHPKAAAAADGRPQLPMRPTPHERDGRQDSPQPARPHSRALVALAG